MKIIHTADWHLGRRLGPFHRAEDLRRAVGRVMAFCESGAADVLLIAGDLFHDIRRADDLCAAVEHLRAAFGPFLRYGGTILAVTGNHDEETPCRTIRHALGLVDPSERRFGETWSAARFYLETGATWFRLPDRANGREVQFVLMPYPTPRQYLDDGITPAVVGKEGKNRVLMDAFRGRLARVMSDGRFRMDLHSVLVSHVYLRGATLSNGHEVADDFEKSDVVLPAEDLASGWAYVALGHVHKPQAVGGLAHVRYSGSIERMSLDERGDDKGVVSFEIGPGGLRGDPAWFPLESTPFYDVVIDDPATGLAGLEAVYPDAARALVRCRVAYTAGVDNPDAIHRRIDEVFPRCYRREVVESTRAIADRSHRFRADQRGFRETVLDYLRSRLEGHANAEAVLAEAEVLIQEVRS